MARNMWLIVFTMNHFWRLLTKEDQDDYSGSEEKKDERIQETEEESSNTGHHKHPRHRHKIDRQDSLNQTSQLIPLPRTKGMVELRHKWNEKFKGQKVQNDYKMEAVQRQTAYYRQPSILYQNSKVEDEEAGLLATILLAGPASNVKIQTDQYQMVGRWVKKKDENLTLTFANRKGRLFTYARNRFSNKGIENQFAYHWYKHTHKQHNTLCCYDPYIAQGAQKTNWSYVHSTHCWEWEAPLSKQAKKCSSNSAWDQ